MILNYSFKVSHNHRLKIDIHVICIVPMILFITCIWEKSCGKLKEKIETNFMSGW